MKKYIAFILSFITVLCITNTRGAAFAANEGAWTAAREVPESAATITVMANETEYLMELLNSTDDELKKRGLTEAEISEVRNYDYNADLLKLKNRDVNFLKKAGYTAEQIEKIKAYDGREDAIAYASTYNLSSAELSGSIWVEPLTLGNSVKIYYCFEWSQAPIFCFTDSVGLAWLACDENSDEKAMIVMYEEHVADYCLLGDDEIMFSKDASKIRTGVGGKREIKYKIGEEIECTQYTEDYYAKDMLGCVAIRTMANSYNLANLSVACCYGHAVIALSGDISLSSSGLGLSVAWNQEDLYNACYTYDASGNLVY